MTELWKKDKLIRACDLGHLTMLCDSADLSEDKVTLLTKMGRPLDVLRELFSKEKIKECIQLCKNNAQNAEISTYLLRLLCTCSSDLQEKPEFKNSIKNILSLIMEQEQHRPQLVLKILQRNDHLPWSAIKDYMCKFLQKDREIQKELDQVLEVNTAKIEEKKEQLKNLEVYPTLVQPNICTLCNSRLENPAIYFLCGHAYHKNCLYEMSCPECVSLLEF